MKPLYGVSIGCQQNGQVRVWIEKEIAELCAFICYGLARFGAILNVDVSLKKSKQS